MNQYDSVRLITKYQLRGYIGKCSQIDGNMIDFTFSSSSSSFLSYIVHLSRSLLFLVLSSCLIGYTEEQAAEPAIALGKTKCWMIDIQANGQNPTTIHISIIALLLFNLFSLTYFYYSIFLPFIIYPSYLWSINCLFYIFLLFHRHRSTADEHS